MSKDSRINQCIRYSELTPQEKEEFIEPGIKSLVSALNSLQGVDTFASCEGHSPEKAKNRTVPNTAYVAFYCSNEEVLKQILSFFKDLSGQVEHKEGYKVSYIKASQRMEMSFYPLYHKHIVYTIRFEVGKFVALPKLIESAAKLLGFINSNFRKPLDEVPIAESGK